MKTIKTLVWISPLAFLIGGCSLPVRQDTTIAEWQREGQLPPTGHETDTIAEWQRGGRLLPTGVEIEDAYWQPQSSHMVR